MLLDVYTCIYVCVYVGVGKDALNVLLVHQKTNALNVLHIEYVYVCVYAYMYV